MMAGAKTQKALDHRVELAANRAKRAEIDEKIQKAKADQAGASGKKRAQLEVTIREYEAERARYPVRK